MSPSVDSEQACRSTQIKFFRSPLGQTHDRIPNVSDSIQRRIYLDTGSRIFVATGQQAVCISPYDLSGCFILLQSILEGMCIATYGHYH